jgi:hypothetical protein
MDIKKIEEIQAQIKKHQSTIQLPKGYPIPAGAGRLSDDLSKVQTTDVIGKGGESDLRK